MSKPTILLVDDEVSILHALRRTLRHVDCRFLTASNASEALEILERESVQLILSDYRMPGITGSSLLKQVAERYPAINRVLLTGMSSPGKTQETLEKGEAHALMYKPWDDEQLRQLVNDYLGVQP